MLLLFFFRFMDYRCIMIRLDPWICKKRLLVPSLRNENFGVDSTTLIGVWTLFLENHQTVRTFHHSPSPLTVKNNTIIVRFNLSYFLQLATRDAGSPKNKQTYYPRMNVLAHGLMQDWNIKY
jgi:hypothetical protein